VRCVRCVSRWHTPRKLDEAGQVGCVARDQPIPSRPPRRAARCTLGVAEQTAVTAQQTVQVVVGNVPGGRSTALVWPRVRDTNHMHCPEHCPVHDMCARAMRAVDVWTCRFTCRWCRLGLGLGHGYGHGLVRGDDGGRSRAVRANACARPLVESRGWMCGIEW